MTETQINQPKQMKNKAITLIELRVVISIAAILAALVLVLVAGGEMGVSDGDRVGIVTKLSHKGLLVKTWEGDMQLGGGIVGTASQPWSFTVVDESLVPAIQQAMSEGRRIKVHYHQKAIVMPWKGDTDYQILEVDQPRTPPEVTR